MTIANGSAVLASDVNAMVSTALGLVQDDNEAVPAGFQFRLEFPDLLAATLEYRRRARFVCPCDLLIEAVAVDAAEHTAATTLDVTIRGDGALVTDGQNADGDDGWGIDITGIVGAGFTKLARLLFDNTRTNVGNDFEGTSRAFRVFPKGSTVEVIVASTGGVATPNEVSVVLLCREFWVRA